MNNETIKTASPIKIVEWLNYLTDLGKKNKVAWSEIYNIIFSENVSKVIFSRFMDFDYYDPDCDYDDDVLAFVHGFSEYVNEKYTDINDDIYDKLDFDNF